MSCTRLWKGKWESKEKQAIAKRLLFFFFSPGWQVFGLYRANQTQQTNPIKPNQPNPTQPNPTQTQPNQPNTIQPSQTQPKPNPTKPKPNPTQPNPSQPHGPTAALLRGHPGAFLCHREPASTNFFSRIKIRQVSQQGVGCRLFIGAPHQLRCMASWKVSPVSAEEPLSFEMDFRSLFMQEAEWQ